METCSVFSGLSSKLGVEDRGFEGLQVLLGLQAAVASGQKERENPNEKKKNLFCKTAVCDFGRAHHNFL